MKKFTLLSIFILFLSVFAFGRHIIGGVITYECLGGGDYEFTMKMYRDCDCENCAGFDSPAQISFYRCGVGGTDCASLEQTDPIFVIDVSDLQISQVTPPDYPCLDPPPVCVQEGVYKWKISDFGHSLPPINESYHVVYQRCCRNETISNLRFPGDQGATFSVEITPAGQRECNSSPVFNSFPPIIICANRALNFDHSATDPDGDRIVYEFCSPLKGGGKILSGNFYTSCAGAKPEPPCPPPFNNVDFIAPDYTPTAPMAGDPVVSIDPNTGVITGTPELQGQYVVGVCATEYRNGVAIGRITRDFQFNVGDCDPTVVGRMDADEILNNGNDFYFRLCGENELTIQNTSFQQRFIENFYWEFDIAGKKDTLTEWSPSISFPDTGRYHGNLILNPRTDCGDTANVFVDVYPAPMADFDFSYDTCVSGPVQFSDFSSVLGGVISEYRWDFGDGRTSDDKNPAHIYRIPGDLPVTLTVTDTNRCETSVTKTVEYFPAPSLIVIAPSAERGCQPLEVFFDNLSFPIDETYDITWDFGDDGSSSEISPTYTYEEPGIYTVSVDIVSPIGCGTDTVFNDLVQVDGSPIAAFDYSPKEVTNFNRTVDFENQSQRERIVNWNFSDLYKTSVENPSYTFRDTGTHFVRLVAVHQSGCRDTVEVRIDVEPKVTFFLPNAFTPNNDSQNDTYKGVGFTEGMTNFKMNIWNRWGELIFETNDPNEGWNGTKNNTGKPSPLGVYTVVVSYVGPRGESVELQGIATVVR